MQNKNNKGWYLLFTAPLFIIFFTVVVIPFVIGIYYSFFKWDGIAANPKVFVGFDNFIKLFGDTRFLESTWKTTLFTILAVISVNIVGLVFALLVTSKLRTSNAARTMVFMPYLIAVSYTHLTLPTRG